MIVTVWSRLRGVGHLPIRKCYVGLDPAAATLRDPRQITAAILLQNDVAGYEVFTQFACQQQLSPLCSPNVMLVYLTIRQCAGNRMRSAWEAETVKDLANRLATMDHAENPCAPPAPGAF
jgi:hypothetical protein